MKKGKSAEVDNIPLVQPGGEVHNYIITDL